MTLLLNAIDGASSVGPVQLETARAFRLSRWHQRDRVRNDECQQ